MHCNSGVVKLGVFLTRWHYGCMVRFELIPARNGALIGEILLDTPATLNAQNLQMVLAMRQQLAQWQDDAAIVAILIRGVGERALCAGGDIKALYYAMLTPGRIHEADDFFRQ